MDCFAAGYVRRYQRLRSSLPASWIFTQNKKLKCQKRRKWKTFDARGVEYDII